jgi:hypothetical protein
MQKKTRSILEELDALYVERDRRHILESRATNVITSAIRLLEQIEQDYNTEQAENLQRKLINAIKLKDPSKFTRSVRRTVESQGNKNEDI